MRCQFRDSQYAHLFAPSSLTQHLFFESDTWKHPQRLSNLTGQSSILYCIQFGLLHQFLGAATDWDWGFPGSSVVRNMPAIQETWVQSLSWEDLLEKGNGNPLQYSCLGKPMDRKAWWATVHGVAKESDMTE